jgi:hypothetical protein
MRSTDLGLGKWRAAIAGAQGGGCASMTRRLQAVGGVVMMLSPELI